MNPLIPIGVGAALLLLASTRARGADRARALKSPGKAKRVPTINAHGIDVSDDGSVVTWKAPLARIDVDGAPKAYKLDNTGLDYIANAYRVASRKDPRYRPHTAPDFPGWGGGAVKDEKGKAVLQGPGQPAPGYLVSPTALADTNYPRTDQRRYVDATVVPYVSIPKELEALGVKQGDFGVVTDGNKTVGVVVADAGPGLREGSVALAEAFGISSSPKHGGSDTKVLSWVIFKGTSRGWPVSLEDIQSTALNLAAQFANQGS